MRKRIFSLSLVLCMVLTMLPLSAWAEGEICGQVAHTHDSSCYQPKLDCGFTAHAHGPECERTERSLVCSQPAPHTHGDSCGDGCGLTQAHIHSGNCPQEGEGFTCGYASACNHSTDACYTVNTYLGCGLVEHGHEEGCYSVTETVLTCTLTEHSHQDSCYPAQCTCETACETMNPDCDVCGAEGAQPADCGKYIPPAPKEEKPYTITGQPLTAPTDLTWTYTTPGKVTVSWKAVPNADNYAVKLSQGQVVTVADTTYTFDIKATGTYSFTVQALGSGSYADSPSAESSKASFFQVTWKNDGTILAEDIVMQGKMPSYSGETPTKAATADTAFPFQGWAPEVKAVEENVIYTAQYTETSRIPAAGAGYTIDYATGKATAANGYEISTDGGTTWAAELTVQPGNTLSVREIGTENKPAGTATKNTLPERPAAPEAPTLSSKTDTTLTVTAVTGQEYSLDGQTWQTSGEFTGLEPKKEYTIYARVSATESGFASEAGPALTVATNASVPAAPVLEIEDYSDLHIKIKSVEGAEYRINDGEWQDDNGFGSLTPDTEYTLSIRMKETDTAAAGEAATKKQYTSPSAPAQNAGFTVDYGKEEVTVNTGYEISTDGGATWVTGTLKMEPEADFLVREKAKEDGKPDSMAQFNTLAARPAAPKAKAFTVTPETVTDKGDGQIAGISDKMEYAVTTANVWTAGTGDPLTGLKAGDKVYIRYRAVTEGDNPAFASKAYVITMQPGTTKLTVTFVSAQGTAPAAQELNYCGTPTNPGPLTATGYTFGGWYTDEAYTEAFDFNDQVRENTTVYAKWTVNRYTLNFQNTGDKTIDPITQDYGTEIVKPADPVRVGWFFDGWDKEVPEKMPAQDMTFTAQWDTVGYKIIQGAAQKIYKGNSATFLSDAPFKKFVAVIVDGVYLDSNECTVVSGSTKAILRASYIRTLANGEHTLTILSDDGWASTTFTVKTYYYGTPRTGDTTNTGLWLALFTIGATGLTAAALGKKHLKKRK